MALPSHIAIIPDGNRRWARTQRLKPWDGHSEGVKTFWIICQELFDLGLDNLTFWAASYDNLNKRSKLEVKFLINLIASELKKDGVLNLALKNKVRVRVLGEWNEIVKDKSLAKVIGDLENNTAHFTKKNLTLLLGYDGRREMVAASNSLINVGKKVTPESLRNNLWTGHLPDVDLVIRTGGEPHWSAGFMMWLVANSELYFTETLWPAFNVKEIKKAIALYDRRERRLGK